MDAIVHPYLKQLQDEILSKDGHQIWQRITVTDFGGGCAEISLRPYETWSEPSEEDTKLKSKRGEGNRERSIEASAARAKRQVRHKAKILQVHYMVTLTTKECLTDIDLMQRYFQEFVRRIRKVSDFHYIATLEYQERGALHMHIAVPNRQDYKFLWSVWHSVVGKDQGRVHVTSGNQRSSVSKIAGYISKYITKSFQEGSLNRKRYWSSKGIPKPKKTHHLLRPDWGIGDVIQYINEICENMGLSIFFHHSWQNWPKGLFWACYESVAPDFGPPLDIDYA